MCVDSSVQTSAIVNGDNGESINRVIFKKKSPDKGHNVRVPQLVFHQMIRPLSWKMHNNWVRVKRYRPE